MLYCLFPAAVFVFIILLLELVYLAVYEVLGAPERRIHLLDRLI